MSKLKTRAEIPEKDKWDLSYIFSNYHSWQKEKNKLVSLVKNFDKKKRQMGTIDGVLSVLKNYYKLHHRLSLMIAYAQRNLHGDLSNAKANTDSNQANDLYYQFLESSAFLESELAHKNNIFLNKMLSDNRFSDYHFMIKNIKREKRHILSEPEEKIMSITKQIAEGSDELFSKLSDSDLDFPKLKLHGKKIKLSHGNYLLFLQSPIRNERKMAMQEMLGSYKKVKNAMSQNIHNHIKSRVLIAKARNYKNTIESFGYSEDIKAFVYEDLFTATKKAFPIMEKYLKIRKKKLGIKTLAWHDLYIPLVKNIKKKFSYSKGVQTVLKSLEPLGPEYKNKAEEILIKKRIVDKYENKNKRSGAYSSGVYGSPSYILLNYSNNFESMSTLTHELGHSVHTDFSAANQSYPNYNYTIFLAEIASTMNEQLLTKYLLESADTKMKKFLINHELEQIRLTFFRQTMFAMFEKKIYNHVETGGTLTPEFLSTEYMKLNQDFYGNVVDLDPLISWEWARIPHFYYNFYVYKYSTGYAIANYFADKVLTGSKKELNNYLNFLKSGGSDYPLNILKKSGFNLAKTNYLETLMNKFDKLLDEFEKL